MENPYFEKFADFPFVMWICGGLAPCDPSALLATKRASFGKKTCHLAIPLIMGQKLRSFKNVLPFFMGQKVVFWVEKRCLGVFWTECEVADPKQRQIYLKLLCFNARESAFALNHFRPDISV